MVRVGEEEEEEEEWVVPSPNEEEGTVLLKVHSVPKLVIRRRCLFIFFTDPGHVKY